MCSKIIMYSFLFHVKFKGVIKVLGTSFCLRLVHLSVRISVHLNSSYTGSDVEEDLKNTENGTLDEYDRIAVSNPDYAAKELCGTIAYNREEPPLGRRIAVRGHEDLSQQYDDGRASG